MFGMSFHNGVMFQGRENRAIAAIDEQGKLIVDSKEMGMLSLFFSLFYNSIFVENTNYKAKYGKDLTQFQAAIYWIFWIARIIILLSLVFSISLYLASFFNITKYASIIQMFLFFLFWFIKIKMEETSKFHGAEHMVCTAEAQRLPLTLENIRKCSPIDRYCGTNIIPVYIIIMKILDFITLRLFNIELGVLFMALVIPLSSWLINKYEWMAIPGKLLQKFFTVRNPTDKQIAVAVIAMELLKWREYGIIPSYYREYFGTNLVFNISESRFENRIRQYNTR